MAKPEGQKMKLFVLNEILQRETDAIHGICTTSHAKTGNRLFRRFPRPFL